MLPKLIIALVAFPMFAHILFSITTLLLDLVQPTLPPMTEATSEVVRQGSVGAAVLIGVVGSFKICRRMWPTPVIRNS